MCSGKMLSCAILQIDSSKVVGERNGGEKKVACLEKRTID